MKAETQNQYLLMTAGYTALLFIALGAMRFLIIYNDSQGYFCSSARSGFLFSLSILKQN